MKILLTCITSLLIWTATAQTAISGNMTLDQKSASNFAQLALNCIQKEYPNKLGQVLHDSTEIASPQELHPAFYGCFDWHSSVHGHWTLVRLLKQFPKLPEAKEIRKKLNENLTADNIMAEVAYFNRPSSKLFERTYGWAWLLKLATELKTFEGDKDAMKWSQNLAPLAELIRSRYMVFLPKLTYPIRTGEHPNTAFGMTFAWDYAVAYGDSELQVVLKKQAMNYYSRDSDAPVKWEPSGFDFLSPSLEEAEMMARILPGKEFYTWVEQFIPGLAKGSLDVPFQPAKVSDRTDGKIVHLDGLNFSRAWCLYRIEKALPGDQPHLIKSAEAHLGASLPHLTSGDYAGQHWLTSFAVYALSCKE